MAYFFYLLCCKTYSNVTKKNEPPIKEIRFVAKLGFEPRQTEPESVVLPLHHLARLPDNEIVDRAG